MDRSAQPWRVLDEPPEAGGATEPATSRAAGGLVEGIAERVTAGSVAIPRAALLVGVAGLAGVALVAASLLLASANDGSVEIMAPGASSRPIGSASGSSDLVVVEVAGAVVRPGVYRLAKGARSGDAIAAAGGYGPRVDAARAGQELNLAALLHDGDRIRVPSRDDAVPSLGAPAAAGNGSTGGATGGAAVLDLNRATSAELDTLPGIGPATAAKIIASRSERPFASVEELLERKLVSSKILEGIRDLLTVK